MLWLLILILVLLWLLGYLTQVTMGGLIHLLLIVAVVVLIYSLATGRRPPL